MKAPSGSARRRDRVLTLSAERSEVGTAATRFVAVVLALLLAVTMIPAAGIRPAFADEPAERPATASGDVALQGVGDSTDAPASANASVAPAATEGLAYSVADGKATLVGFEEGAALEGAVVVPESVDGAAVTAVEIAEGQVAEGVTSLTLPQTVESVETEGLASAFPSLASIEIDGTAGVYSTSGGMLFLQGKDAASSDGSTTLAKNHELVWAPPALVVARLPIECKSIAAGAFTDAAALETVMCPGVMESIAVAEKDGEGNVTKPGAFTDEQITNLSIVVPGTNIASPSGDRVSASVALSEDEGMEAKREAWWKHGFDSDKIVMGTSFGEVEGVVAVSDDGTVEEPSIDVLKPYEKKQLAEAAESGDEEAAEKLAAPEGSGLSFSYNADMNLSVGWAGDKTATPAAIEIPAYVTIDGVKYAVTEVAPEAFKGAVFLTSATIPEGVRVIGESAFEGCSNLKEVGLPSTLKTIDYAAFKSTALESVTIPEGTTYIGGEAFADCASLEDARIGAATLIGANAFADSPADALMHTAAQQTVENENASELQEATVRSTTDLDGIASYAALTGISEFTNDFYSMPSNVTAAKSGFGYLPSPFYTIKYLRNKTHTVTSAVCPEDLCSPDSVYTTGLTATDNTIGSWGYWNQDCSFDDGSGTARPGHSWTHNVGNGVVVYYEGKRCLYAGWSVDGGEYSEICQHNGILMIPNDGVYLTGSGTYGTNGAAVFTGGVSPRGWYCATFAPEMNSLTVTASSGVAQVKLTPNSANTGGWVSSGDTAKVGDTFTISSDQLGYRLDPSTVSVSGAGSSYDPVTNTLTMGYAPTTVSATLIPNDIDISFNLPHATVTGKQAGVYGDDNVTWGEGDASNTMTIGTEATKDNTNGTTPMPNTTTVTVSGSQATFKNGQGQTGYAVTITPHNGWQHQGAWALSYKEGDQWVDEPSFTSTQSAVIDYTKEWRLTPIVTGRTFTITYDDNHANAAVSGGQYTTGNGLTTTPTPRRTGFWFAGWAWANDAADRIDDPTATSGFGDASWYPGDGIDADEPSFTISDSAYGNAQLKAIWKPKTYKIQYNVEATEKDDGSYWVDTPADDVFVHPSARVVIASGSNVGAENETWAFTKSAADFRSQDGIDVSALTAGEGDAAALDEGAINYELPKVPFKGYLYKGWTKQVALPAGLSVSKPDDGPYLAFSAEVAGKLWPNKWDSDDVEPAGTYVASSNLITLYGVWLRQGVVTVNLESTQPAEVSAGDVDDGLAVKVNGANVADAHVQPIAYWKDRGLMLYGEMGEPGHNITGVHEKPASDSKIADTCTVNGKVKQRAFQAPTRTGFRFLGWGKDGKLFIKYFENAEGAAGTGAGAHEQGFYLTPEGVEYAMEWDSAGKRPAADEEQSDTWQAMWEIRTYKIELMVPGSTIKGYSGVSAKDKQLNNEYVWDDSTSYKWEKEITIGDDKTYATSWRKATKEWKYYDAFYVPFYELNSPFNTYGGWFTGTRDENTGVVTFDRSKVDQDGNVVPIISEAAGRARYIDGGEAFRVSAAGLGAKHLWGASAPDGQETDLDNVTAPDGTITLWLYTEPVYINVSAPMGIFLANDDPYVVGSDPRTVLEQEASFTVKESNQNLVLTSITATDIVEADVEQGTYNANAAYPVENVVTVDDDAGVGQQGITSRMLTLDTRTDGGKGTAQETAYNQENSRVFWVSPVKTVEDYVAETDSAPNEMNMTSRVYFGFGSETESGLAANNGDNVVEDDPDDEKDFNFLKAFKLREAYDGTAGNALSGRNGVAVTTDDAGVTYTCAESAGTGAGSTAGTVAGAKYRDPANAEWTLGVSGGKYTLTGAGGAVVNVKKPVVYRDYSFWYGLDLNKCSFDLAEMQAMVEGDSAWSYNAGYKKPLVKLMFTFAVERVPNVSYGIAALSADGAGAGAGVEAASLDERAGTEGGDVDAAELVNVGGVSAAL